MIKLNIFFSCFLSRITKERDLLQRQKTNISVVSDNLQLVQVQLEGADHMQRIVLKVNKFYYVISIRFFFIILDFVVCF